MKERKVVIVTHGKLAEGFKSALEIITGAQNVEAYNCYTSPDFNLNDLIEKIMKSVNKEKEELFVFTDLLGGSVNNGFIKALKDYDFHLITNTTLGLLIDFLLVQPDINMLREKLKSNEFNAVYCNDCFNSMSNIEEDL
ncbi:hypothetical protein MOZ60_08520 [Stecheria sp. CLA-KB-P133]|uniref:PTS EIIA type-4 domain-containing protein n=1 Tax=Grylomicrobium aquisgranensis TaxID=2926318 RepID=A0AB35U952_9FIRM|nr:hypothetical protein [Stecheria sp. CLA-KB-P133]